MLLPQVTDVFAAVALKGMLEVLTSEGTVMVMTSNRAPDDLNSQGLHEDLFDHFVGSLKERCDPVEVWTRRSKATGCPWFALARGPGRGDAGILQGPARRREALIFLCLCRWPAATTTGS